jgi:mono/diheme cytochrome c family protein
MQRMIVVLCSVVLLLGTAAAQIAFGPISGDAGKGKQLYYDYGCYGCHGYGGIGRKNIANDVSGIMSREEIYLTFLRAREDMNPLFPTQSMPNYPANSLSDEDALDIYAYIRTFKDDPPATQDIPALKAILEAAEE